MDQYELADKIAQARDEEWTTLDLSEEEIGNYDLSFIGDLTSLTELELGGNDLAELPPEIGNLINLSRLRVPRNQLTALPPEIGNLTALAALYLNDNQMTALTPEMKKLLDKKVFLAHWAR